MRKFTLNKILTTKLKPILDGIIYLLKGLNAVIDSDAGSYYNNCSVFSMEYHYVNKPNLLIDIEKAKKLNQKIDASPQVINAAINEYSAERKMVRKNFVKWVNSILKIVSKKNENTLIDSEYEVLHQFDGDLSDTLCV